MNALTCNHGFWLTDCKLCQPLRGECDYGACEQHATHLADTHRRGKLIETRPMCLSHARKSASTLRSMTYRPMS